MDHLLLHSDLAQQVWSFFANIMHANLHEGISSTILGWYDLAKGCSFRSTLLGILPGYISWHIWKERCNRRLSGKYNSWRRVLTLIIADCNHMLSSHAFSYVEGDAASFRRVAFTIPMSPKKSYLVIRWVPPTEGLKANVDGSATATSSGSRGIVRDQVLEAGSYSSILARKVGPFRPPAISTSPVGKGVAEFK